MNRFTLTPVLVALLAGLATLTPTNIYKVCAWNAGTLALDPWRRRTSTVAHDVARTVRSWLSSIFTRRLAFACLAVLLALLVVHLSGSHDGVLLAVSPAVAPLETKRAKLLREAEALRGSDGSFKDDATRAQFDAKMTELEAVDKEIEQAERGQSEFIRTEDPLARGSRRPAKSDTPEKREPTDIERGADIENARVIGILEGCEAARLPKSFARKLIEEKVSLLEAQKRIFQEMKLQTDPEPTQGPNGAARAGEHDAYVFARRGIENALLHRVNPEKFKLEEIGREYRGMSMLDIAKAYLQSRGERVTSLDRMEIAGKALGLLHLRGGMHTTSDFPLLLADVANKSLRADYEAAPQTFMPITRLGTVPDFKLANRVQIGDAPALHPVGQHGEFTRGTIEEGREQVQAATYGRVFAITRTALINDDLDSFSRVPTKFGRMARNLESDLVWYQILKNANMADGNALFSAAHSNYVAAGDIGVPVIGAAEKAMLMQRGLDGTTLIVAQPKYLIVGPTKKVQAQQFIAQINATKVDDVNPYAGQLQVIVEPRLEAGITIGVGGGALTAAGSAFAWYIAADKNQIDIIELVFLEGQNGPVIESRIGFDVDGLEIKCREDVGAKVIDHRGLYKSDGSDNS